MEQVLYYVMLVPTILMAITFHEFAHARLALAFGDPTAYEQGRVSLNPLRHLDPLGTAMIFLVGFGWGRPVPVNPARLRHPRADAVVSAAGPLMNLLLAAGAAVAMRLLMPPEGLAVALSREATGLLFLYVFIQINLALCVFNLIPLFPLDGSHVLEALLPRSLGLQVFQWNRRYGGMVLLGIILLGYLTHIHLFALILNPPLQFLNRLLLGV